MTVCLHCRLACALEEHYALPDGSADIDLDEALIACAQLMLQLVHMRQVMAELDAEAAARPEFMN